MKQKKLKMLAAALLTGALCVSGVSAANTNAARPTTAIVNAEVEQFEARARKKFDFDIGRKVTLVLTTPMSLEAGDTMRVLASCEDKINFDIGLIDSNGKFYYYNTTSGSIDQTFRVQVAGEYRLAVRNNDSWTRTIFVLLDY